MFNVPHYLGKERKKGTHINFCRGILGSKRGSQTGHFGPRFSLLFLFLPLRNLESVLLAEPHVAVVLSCRTLTRSAKVSCRTLQVAEPKVLHLEKDHLAEPWNAGSFRKCPSFLSVLCRINCCNLTPFLYRINNYLGTLRPQKSQSQNNRCVFKWQSCNRRNDRKIDFLGRGMEFAAFPYFQNRSVFGTRRPPDYSSNRCLPKTFAICLSGGVLGLLPVVFLKKAQNTP